MDILCRTVRTVASHAMGLQTLKESSYDIVCWPFDTTWYTRRRRRCAQKTSKHSIRGTVAPQANDQRTNCKRISTFKAAMLIQVGQRLAILTTIT